MVNQSLTRGMATSSTSEFSSTSGSSGGLPMFGGGYCSTRSHLEEGDFEQDDGAAYV